MIVTCNRIPVNPEHAAAFEERFADRASLVDGMDGFIAFQLLRPTKPDDPYIVMTFWESEEHFKAWTESEEFKEGHARSGTLPPQTFRGHPKLEIYEVIQSTLHTIKQK
ncbi:MAG: antibiotic biosynthesis monooxygenase [Phototrophicales bacterium]|nr:MAG: antibiotic biosynthesis monooxygenase [Phototrophicales bacterium]